MKNISALEVQKKLEQGEKLNIIDVREVYEVREGKIPGAVNIPLAIIPARTMDLDRRKEYILVCHSGARSANATYFLEGEGFNVINMRGGMSAWRGAVE